MKSLTGRPWLLPVAIAMIAFVVRWASVASVGGLHALLGYDEGVYMGAATALAHGLLPYRDFTLVHPPGSTVLLLPFAELGRLTSEPTGWAAARVGVMVLGGVNAGLVTVVARRVSTAAALSAGVLYALWEPVVHVERTTMLEAFVLTGLLVALVALPRARVVLWQAAAAGAALGLATSVKLWGAVPLVVIVVWLLIHRAWRQAAVASVAAVVLFAVVAGPFLAGAGRRMVQLVVLAQLGRGDGGTAMDTRPERMLSMGSTTTLEAVPRHVVWIAAALLCVALVLVVWRRPAGRLWSALLMVQSAVLLAVPVYFAGYSSFIGPALALVVGAFVDVALKDPRPRSLRLMTGSIVVLCVGLLAVSSSLRILGDGDSISGPDPVVSALTNSSRCVASDSTGLLLMYDALGRSIDAGCARPLIDVDGTVYAVAQANPERLTAHARREESLSYQRDLYDYFVSSDVVLIHRATADGMDPDLRKALAGMGLTRQSPGLRVFGNG